MQHVRVRPGVRPKLIVPNDLSFLPPEPMPMIYLDQRFKIESMDPVTHRTMRISAPDGREFFVDPSDFEFDDSSSPERQLLNAVALIVRKWRNHDLAGFDVAIRELQMARDDYLYFKIKKGGS